MKDSDRLDRIGPLRGMQKGVITQQEMERALIITVVLTCLSGPALVTVAYHTLTDFVGSPILDGLSITTAITYTVGNCPCDYIGLDDASVLVFFGWLSVTGSRYLQAHTLVPALILLATTRGLPVTAVLNISNLRDINNDRENGKDTLVVRLDAVNACRHHAYLLIDSLVCLTLFNFFSLHGLQGRLFLLAAPLLVKQARYMMCEMDPVMMRPMLEHTVKGTLLVNLLLVSGIFLS